VHRGSQGIELALDAAQVAATRGNLTCRLGLTFRKSSPRIKQHPAEKRNQNPSCVYFGNNRHVLCCTILFCTVLCCTILALRIRQGRKNQGDCDQSAGFANAVLKSRKHMILISAYFRETRGIHDESICRLLLSLWPFLYSSGHRNAKNRYAAEKTPRCTRSTRQVISGGPGA